MALLGADACLRRFLDYLVLVRVSDARAHEAVVERGGARRSRFVFRMRLRAEEERMRGEFDHLDEIRSEILAGDDHAVALEQLAVLVVELEAMPVALADLILSVEAMGERAWSDMAGIGTQAHRAAHRLQIALVLHEIDDGVQRFRLDLARMRLVESAHVARELDAG